MKTTLNVRWDESSENYIITDITPSILKLFDIDGNAEDIISTELRLPVAIKYLDLVRKTNIHYIEFLYPINNISYTVRIVEEKNDFTLFFDSLFTNKYIPKIGEKEDYDAKFIADIEGLFSNDKTFTEIFAMKNATSENINLEILFVAKKVYEQLQEFKTEWKESYKELDSKIDATEDNTLKKNDLDIYFILGKIGFKKIIIFIFIIAIVETLIIEPFITPVIKQIQESITNVVDE